MQPVFSNLGWKKFGDALCIYFLETLMSWIFVCDQGRTVFKMPKGISKSGLRTSCMELMQGVDPRSRKTDEVPQNKTIH